jgi:methyl-accepting chemotaxis protein
MNIRNKLVLGAGLLALLPVAITALVVGQGTYTSARDALLEQTQARLVAQREDKRAQVEAYFDTLTRGVQSLARSTTVVDAAKSFKASYPSVAKDASPAKLVDYRAALLKYYSEEFGSEFKKRNASPLGDMTAYVNKLDDIAVVMQYQYLVANANPIGKKKLLTTATDGSAYSKAHAAFHPSLSAMVAKLGYYDFFLVDVDQRRVMYTVEKETDFASQLETGIAAKTPLDVAVNAVLRARGLDDSAKADYKPYLASYNDQASFIAVPVFDGDTQIAVMAVQVPIDDLTAIMTSNKRWEQVGLGKTGEVFIAGTDGFMRTDARLVYGDTASFLALTKNSMTPEAAQQASLRTTSIGLVQIKSEAVKKASAGVSSAQQFTDYLGNEAFGAFSPLGIEGLSWVIVAKQDTAEVFASVQQLARDAALRAGLTALAVVALAALAATVFLRAFLKPIAQLTTTVQKLQAGDFAARANIQTGDELEVLGKSLDTLLDDRLQALDDAQRENEDLNGSVITLLETVSLVSQRDLTVRAPVMQNVIGTVADSINYLTDETEKVLSEVNDVADQVDAASSYVKSQATVVAETANTERNSVLTMAKELEEATGGIRRVAGLADSSSQAAERAIATAQSAQLSVAGTVKGMTSIRETISEVEKRIKRLGERSQEISQIVNLINQISERTHVLALNASMQAAMAGEAGRGFAVVAEEVQRLADNARGATTQIAGLVYNIQVETNDTINTVNKTIDQVVQGSELAVRSGEDMNNTEASTRELVDLVQRIAASSVDQVRIATALQTRMDEIVASTQTTSRQVESQSESADLLVQSAKRLVDTVSVFKLKPRV